MPQERKARRSAYADGGLSFKSRKSQATARREFRENLFRQCFLHRNGTSNGRELTMLLVPLKKASAKAKAFLSCLLRHTFLYSNGTSNGRGLTMLLVPLKKASAKAKAFLIAYLDMPSCTATAQATVMPTIGLLPAPIRPIISTCAGTEEEPANCASECIRPIVSVMP